MSVLFGDAFEHVHVLVVLCWSEVRDHFISWRTRFLFPVLMIEIRWPLIDWSPFLLEDLLEEFALVNALNREQKLFALIPTFSMVVSIFLDLSLLFGVYSCYARYMPSSNIHNIFQAVSKLLLMFEGFNHRLIEFAQDLLSCCPRALIQKCVRPFLWLRLIWWLKYVFVVLYLEEYTAFLRWFVLLWGPIPLHKLLWQGLRFTIPEVPQEMLAWCRTFVNYLSRSDMRLGVALFCVSLFELSLLAQKPVKFLLLFHILTH